MKFRTIEQVIRTNYAIGARFFSDNNMSFFGSKVESGLIGGKFFITSETTLDRLGTAYTIRMVDNDGNIETVGEICQYSSVKTAQDSIKFIRKGACHD
jgi:hypothetical protein